MQYQDIPPPSAASVYKNVKEITMNLSDLLAKMILDKITLKMDMQDSIAFSTFYNEGEIKNGSEEFYVFQSDHYRRAIFDMAERIIKSEGYECKIDMDDTSRTKRIMYDAIVVHPFRRIIKLALYVSPILMSYGSVMLYDYISRRNADENMISL